ncbi:MAG: hypothetical protein RDU14_03470 [Melioribacteraceae bacterium]|nr:hypothetical protein [Melioribacteraceae bacterium]
MLVKYFLLWFPMVIIAIINGTIRQLFFTNFSDELGSHQLSVISGITFFAIYIWFITGKWEIESALMAIKIGLMWLVMTVIFEFLFGHYVMGNSWEKLLHDYNLLEGRLWVVVLIWTTISPSVFYLIRKQKSNTSV